MKKYLYKLTSIFLPLGIASTALAQSQDWYVADAVAGGQISVGRNITEHMSFEGLLGYNKWGGFDFQGTIIDGGSDNRQTTTCIKRDSYPNRGDRVCRRTVIQQDRAVRSPKAARRILDIG